MNEYFAYSVNHQCKVITVFRTRSHSLPVEIGRWASMPQREGDRWFCNDDRGYEFHNEV